MIRICLLSFIAHLITGSPLPHNGQISRRMPSISFVCNPTHFCAAPCLTHQVPSNHGMAREGPFSGQIWQYMAITLQPCVGR